MDIPFSPPDIGETEIELVNQVLRSGWITTGPMTKRFEQEIAAYCSAERAVCLASATAAMELSLRILGVGPGDEVITCAYTYTASASVAAHVGAKPILVDCDPDHPFLSAARVAEAIGPRTKAIIPVDLGGIPIDYDALREVLRDKQKLFVANGDLQQALGRIAIVEDAAHAFGATYRGESVARQSDFCCFSFHAVKNLTTAEGGAVVFGDIGDITADEIYRRFMLCALHGQNKDALAKTKLGAWEYDIILPGYKANMTDIMAAIGLGQLSRYPALLQRREELVARYDAHFAGTAVRPLRHKGRAYVGSHHLYIVTIDGIDEQMRNGIIVALAEQGVSANVHYKPLPMMTAYKAMGYEIKDFPNAFNFYQKEVTLPLHTLLTDAQVDFAAETLLRSVGTATGKVPK